MVCTGDVEGEVAERQLERVVDASRVGRECRQRPGDGRAEVGAERQRIDALDGDDAEPDERRQRRREHRAALHEHRHAGADQHRRRPRESGGVAGQVGVDGAADEAAQRAA